MARPLGQLIGRKERFFGFATHEQRVHDASGIFALGVLAFATLALLNGNAIAHEFSDMQITLNNFFNKPQPHRYQDPIQPNPNLV